MIRIGRAVHLRTGPGPLIAVMSLRDRCTMPCDIIANGFVKRDIRQITESASVLVGKPVLPNIAIILQERISTIH